MGSSPLTRGKRAHGLRLALQPGLIPAHAGKTRPWSPSCPSARAHPRSRGENHLLDGSNVVVRGSSPLTRGKPLVLVLSVWVTGLIPAHAGKTGALEALEEAIAAHPRSRGENPPSSGGGGFPLGSSPLTRGKRPPPQGEPLTHRLIPAHAGKTSSTAETGRG